MRVVTHLKTLRVLGAALSLTEVEEITGIGRGELSRIENGRALPRDEWIAQLELVYGPAAQWYPPEQLLLIQRDQEEA